MRRTAASILALSLLLLAGCANGGSGDGASPSATPTAAATASAHDIAALAAVTLTGEPGTEPTLDFEKPFTVSAPVARIADPGTGDTVAEGNLLTVNLVAVSGADGTSAGTTFGTDPAQYPVNAATLPEALLHTMVGAQVGARILYAAPAAEGTQIWAFELLATEAVPTRAEGTAVTPPAGLPTVTLAENGQPSIKPVDGDAPTELVVQPLIQGSGAVIEAGQNLTIQYSGWLWDGTSFDSSWEKGTPFTTSLSNLIQGWQQGLVGQTVGSQVLLIVPPDLGYGDQDSNQIPAGSTLIFVIDILSAG